MAGPRQTLNIMIKTLYPCFQHWSAHGSVWLYSDTHFADAKLKKFIDRPDDETQIKNINRYVNKQDTLVLLGDVGDINAAAKLNGYKVLITGNHDRGVTYYQDVFDEVYGGPLLIAKKIILSHERINLPFTFNIHGHEHGATDIASDYHLNVCSDVCNYTPVSLKAILSNGISAVPDIHSYYTNLRQAEKT